MTTARKPAAKKAPVKKADRDWLDDPAQRAQKAPAKKAAPSSTSVAARVKKLERELAETRWCFAELLWKAKVAAVKQMFSDPKVQEAIAAQMISQNPQLG